MFVHLSTSPHKGNQIWGGTPLHIALIPQAKLFTLYAILTIFDSESICSLDFELRTGWPRVQLLQMVTYRASSRARQRPIKQISRRSVLAVHNSPRMSSFLCTISVKIVSFLSPLAEGSQDWDLGGRVDERAVLSRRCLHLPNIIRRGDLHSRRLHLERSQKNLWLLHWT